MPLGSRAESAIRRCSSASTKWLRTGCKLFDSGTLGVYPHRPLDPPPSYKPVFRPKNPPNRAPAHDLLRSYRRAAISISNTASSRTSSKWPTSFAWFRLRAYSNASPNHVRVAESSCVIVALSNRFPFCEDGTLPISLKGKPRVSQLQPYQRAC